jgi:hypothetical protein
MGEEYWLNTRPGSRLLANTRACIIAKIWLLIDTSRVGGWLRDVCSPSGYERLVIQNAVTISDVNPGNHSADVGLRYVSKPRDDKCSETPLDGRMSLLLLPILDAHIMFKV